MSSPGLGGGFVRLNVGGEVFVTSKARLTSSSSFFEALLSERIPTAKDETGAILIDRSGAPFRVLLDILRTGWALLPPSLTAEAIAQEAEFYALDIDVIGSGVLRSPSDPDPPPNPAAMAAALESDGFYCLVSSPEASASSVSAASSASAALAAAASAAAGSGSGSGSGVRSRPGSGLAIEYTRFLQLCPGGRCNVIAPKTRGSAGVSEVVGSPNVLVVSPTVRFTYHAAGSMFFVDELELTVQDFGVDSNFGSRFTAFHGVVYPGALLGRSYEMRYYPSVPPCVGMVYHVQVGAGGTRHTPGSNVVMLQFTSDESAGITTPPGGDSASDGGDAVDPTLAESYTGPAWARGTLSYTVHRRTIHAMKFETARYRLRRVQTHVSHDLRGRNYLSVETDDEGNVVGPLPSVIAPQDVELEDQDMTRHAPMGSCNGHGLLWHIDVLYPDNSPDRTTVNMFSNARVLSLGPIIIVEILGSQNVYVTDH